MEEDYQEPESSKLTLKSSYIIKRIMKYLKPHWKLFAFSLALYLITSSLSAMEPTLIGWFVDELTKEGIEYSQVAVYGGYYAICITVNCILTYFAGLSVQVMAQGIILDLRQDVFSHIQTLSISQLHKVPVGKWVTRATNDVNSLMSFFSDVLVSIISNMMFLGMIVVMVFVKDWRLAFVDLAFIPVIVVVSWIFAYYSKKHYRLLRSSISSMNGFLSENLSGMETIQVFNQEERKMKEFDDISKKLKKNDWDAMTVFAVFRPLIYSIYTAAIISVFAVGLHFVDGGTMTIGTLYSFYLYTEYLFYPIQNIANQFNSVQSALAGAERVIIVLDTPSEIVDSKDAKPLEKMKGKIEFRHVWFAYKGEEWILKDVSFVINPGDTVAFVGETGAGKSTIINLMVRNFDIQKGEILIDDINIRNITLDSLRKNIGEMLQDVFLFSGTVRSNISLDDKDMPESDIEAAAKFVGADDFINKLPKKYDEPVLENGNNFSQGQRQLISFARVVTYKPSVVVLDEATANIDTETEVIIQNSLEKIKSIGTMVMVAHRLSTIKHASMIYVVDHGVIVESGNHQALLKKRGIYYNLYKLQTTEKDLAS
jgi:ATP-binding cassette subfamily B multidrug efflux pump